MSDLPSLNNPPNAPKKKKLKKLINLASIPKLSFNQQEEEQEAKKKNISSSPKKSLSWKVSDLERITDVNILHEIKEMYQDYKPSNVYEFLYVDSLTRAIEHRLKELK